MAVGESWKVRDFSRMCVDPGRVVIDDGEGVTRIITDDPSCESGDSLACCAAYWSQLREHYCFE